jgi:hypothetical protein
MTMFRLLGGVAAIAVASTLSVAAYAQDTASGVRGTIADASGSGVAGASVTLVHTPSGTTSQVVTGQGGSFFQSGLRVGGPYSLTIQAQGFEPIVVDGIFFQPGNANPFSATLRPNEVETIIVRGQALEVSELELNNGVGSAFDARDIANQPTISRDVISTLLRDPLAQSGGTGNLSVAGVNPRFNGFAIDGSRQKDDFGLGSNTSATSRSPINLDAVESVTLSASDYSVTSTGFVGGLINVVTKSGTNEFDGSAFYYYRDPEFVGETAFGDVPVTTSEFEEKEYGITLGGPIIKDKLFFFGSYDKFESASSYDFTQSNASRGIQPGFYSAIRNLVNTTYGVDIGEGATTGSNPVSTERLLGKIDWNINDFHRASFIYQSTEETGVSNVSGTNFSTAWYDVPVELKAYSGQLYSDWSDNFSTTLRANYKEFTRGQICRGQGLGQIEMRLSEADLNAAGTGFAGLLNDGDANTNETSDITFIAGCDRFRHANEYDDSRLQLFGAADYVRGNHVFTFGGEFEQFELFNLFVDTSRGNFRFDDIINLQNGVANSVAYRNDVSNNANAAASDWGYDKLALFAMDAWQIRPDLELTYGLRYETYLDSESTPADAGVTSDYGFNPSRDLTDLSLLMPRASLRWEASDETTVTAGFGLFAGGEPHVWLSNAFQPGTVFTSANNVAGVDLASVPASLQSTVAAGTTRIIDIIDPDFNIPSDWKASLRVQHEFGLGNAFGLDLGDGYLATGQVLFTKSNDGFLWRNIAQTQLAGALPTGVAPDGRTIYADLQALGEPSLTMLTNGDGGQSIVLSGSVQKSWDFGLDGYVGYAFQDVEAISEGTSSRGISSWRGITDADRNNPTARTSPFQIEHTFRVGAGYERDFFGDLTTRVDVFGDITSGAPFTLTYDINDSNHLFGRAGQGEGPFDNNPLYIPVSQNDPLVTWDMSQADIDAFFNYVDRLDATRGSIHEVNSARSTWNQRWDVRLQQDLPGIPGANRFVGDNNFKVVLDVINFGNLLNDEWGTQYSGPGNNQLPIVTADLVDAANPSGPALTNDAARTTCVTAGSCVYRYRDFDADPTSFRSTGRSVYQVRVGLRYEF